MPERRFCLCSDQDYCARMSTYGMTDKQRAAWLRQREVFRAAQSVSVDPGANVAASDDTLGAHGSAESTHHTSHQQEHR